MSESVLRGTSSSTRTLDQRELAALRPVRGENAPKPRRKPAEKRAVTSGIVCFCGERFGEDQALEFMLHLRAEVGEVLEWRERYFARRRERERARYANNPEYREAERLRRKDPEYRARVNGRKRSQYANDLEYRERQRERWRKHWQDPEFRERKREHDRERQRERRARAKASPTATK